VIDLVLASIGLLLAIISFTLVKIHKGIDVLGVTNIPRDGLPQNIEAAWEDIGDHGRMLTDLGGMSAGMREQLFDEFCKALTKPIKGVQVAGSLADVLSDMDAYLTKMKVEETRDTESSN